MKHPTRTKATTMSEPMTNTSLVLLYDGVCGLCARSVQTILKYDRRGTMMFAPLQSDYGRAVVERHPALREVNSLVLLETAAADGSGERVYVRSEAALRVAGYLGGWWRVLACARVIPAPLRDFVYNFVARNRYRVFGKSESCLLPPSDVRVRFLDTA